MKKMKIKDISEMTKKEEKLFLEALMKSDEIHFVDLGVRFIETKDLKSERNLYTSDSKSKGTTLKKEIKELKKYLNKQLKNKRKKD